MFKIAFFLLSIFIFSNCSNNTNLANCIRSTSVNVSSDLNNPQLINVKVPGGFVELSGGLKGILLLNVNGTDFVAYDKICPANDCNTSMIFESPFLLRCVCDDSVYGVGLGIGGAPQTPGFECPAIEYNVTKIGTAIRISNF